MTRESTPSVPHVGRTFAIVVFVSMLIAFVVESEMTQVIHLEWVSSSMLIVAFSMCKLRWGIESRSFYCNVSFGQMLFTVLTCTPSYVVHSSFAIIFPLHLLYLKATTSHSTRSLMRGLSMAISDHMRPSTSPPSSNPRFPYIRFACFILILTTICNTPGLLWFASITLAS